MKNLELVDRAEDLMSGKVKPENKIEDIFMLAFSAAMYPKEFLDVYIDIYGKLDYSNIDELHAFCLGFGLGGKRFNELVVNLISDETKH